MTYDVFLEQMKNDLQTAFSREMSEKYSQVKIGIRDVEKLQGESYRGISFRIGDSPIEGNLNLQQSYQEQEAGIPYSEILRQTKEAITQQVYRMPQFNLGELSSYEAVKQSMMMELIPQKGNEERLAEIPHRDVEDMALIYRMDMGGRLQWQDDCVLRPLPDKNAATSGRGADSHRTSSGDHRTLQDGRYWLQCNESWPAIALRQLAMSILGVISLPSDLS